MTPHGVDFSFRFFFFLFFHTATHVLLEIVDVLVQLMAHQAAAKGKILKSCHATSLVLFVNVMHMHMHLQSESFSRTQYLWKFL